MKQVLITGASTGIGFELAKTLCARDYKVWAGVRKPEVLMDLQKKFPNQLVVLKLDVTEAAEVENAFQKVSAELDPTKELVIVNNAGIAIGGPIETLSIEEWKKVFETNVFGLLNVTQRFLPLLRKTQGRIFNIGSISGRITSPFLAPYSASKFAVRSITDALRREVGHLGVKVILIEPGPIKTEIWTKSMRQSEIQQSRLSAEMNAVYGESIETLKAGVLKAAEEAISVDEVVSVMIEGIESEEPQPYYLVGKNIHFIAFMARFFPISWLDKLLARGFRGRAGSKA